MCGICGFNGELSKHIGKKGLTNMLELIKHRGPDDQGIYLEENIGIGMRRLSIIDIENGLQPVHNENKDIWVVFNGEIYNFRELRKDLINKKHRFNSESDTEVLVHLYEEYGEEFVQKLIGMFAIAIWDGRNKKLLLVRDRMGEKPLYYCTCNNTLIFASEIKSILGTGVITAELNTNLIGTQLLYRYIPGEQTLFKNIYKLMPGHMLLFTNNTISIKQYWDIAKKNEFEGKTEAFYMDKIVSLMNESVKYRMESDVPVGIFLSGGLDSSIILNEASKFGINNINTFCVAFEKPQEGISVKKYSELNYASMVSKKYSTMHHEYIINTKSIINDIDDFIWHMDEPIGDPTVIPLFYLSKFAKNHVGVVLSGEGADEIFAGYRIYSEPQKVNLYNSIPMAIRNNIITPLLNMMPFSYGKNFLMRSQLSISDRYSGVGTTFRTHEIPSLLSREFGSEMFDKNVSSYVESIFINSPMDKDELSQMLYFDQKVWLPEDTLVKSDKISMANSLELRVPFLDHRMVELAASIPSNLKYKGNCEKYILKKAYSKMLPEFVIKRKKNGFPVPITSLLNNEFYDYAKEILLSSKTINRGYFNKTYLENLLGSRNINGNYKGRQVWLLLTFELWNRIFIDKNINELLIANYRVS
jgi:asparagine synthase (glutamine-hydrolysing)